MTKILSLSVFWRNDAPDGIGITYAPPGFSSEELDELFRSGQIVKQFFIDSDQALGTDIVATYLAQLGAIGRDKAAGKNTPEQQIILATLNILWLTSRGFIPNDEFNGVQWVYLA